MKYDGFIGPAYSLKNVAYDCQTLVNWYCEVDETGKGREAEVAQFRPRPGLKKIMKNLPSPSRGLFEASNGKLYGVFGDQLHVFNSNGSSNTNWTTTRLTSGIPGIEPVQFADNSLSLFIIADGQPYAYTYAGGAFTILSGGAYTAVSSMTYIDGRVVFTEANSKRFFWTDVLSLEAPALNFASAETDPEDTVGLINNNLDLWIFGKRSIEIWYNASQGNTIFARRGNALIDTGCAAARTIQKLNNTVAWLSVDNRGGPIMMVAAGYSPQRISTFALEQYWSNFTADQIKGASGYPIQLEGHNMYVLNIPGSDTTWVYDFTSSQQMGKPMWSEWKSDKGDGFQGRHLAVNQVYHKGNHVCSDYIVGTVYVMEGLTDNDMRIMRERTAPHISNEMKRIIYTNLILLFSTGIVIDQNLDPQAIIQFSDDGGYTWSEERWVSAGKVGQYGLRVDASRLGSGRNRVFRIRCYDPIDWQLSGATLDVKVGAH